MTLNITLASSWLMLQSSDFKLTVDSHGSNIPVSETAQKQVVLQYFGWSGLLCYTGIAKSNDHDTAEWLNEILEHPRGQRSVKEIVSLIATEGNKWLVKVSEMRRMHTFTLMAYVDKIPWVYVISNIEWVGGRRFPNARNEFIISNLKPRKPRCLPTGRSSALTSEQRRRLEICLASTTILSRENLAKTRYILASASKEASSRSDTIGKNCVVAHLLPDGSGEAQIFGNLKSPYLPSFIVHGTNTVAQSNVVFQETKVKEQQTLVGVTWDSLRSGSATAMALLYRDVSEKGSMEW